RETGPDTDSPMPRKGLLALLERSNIGWKFPGRIPPRQPLESRKNLPLTNVSSAQVGEGTWGVTDVIHGRGYRTLPRGCRSARPHDRLCCCGWPTAWWMRMRRLACARRAKTYTLAPLGVVAVKKSRARVAWARPRRNAAQV